MRDYLTAEEEKVLRLTIGYTGPVVGITKSEMLKLMDDLYYYYIKQSTKEGTLSKLEEMRYE